MLWDCVIIPVVNHTELPQNIAPYDRLDRPIVALLALALAIQPLDVEDFRADSLQYDVQYNVQYDAKMMLLVDRQLIDQ